MVLLVWAEGTRLISVSNFYKISMTFGLSMLVFLYTNVPLSSTFFLFDSCTTTLKIKHSTSIF